MSSLPKDYVRVVDAKAGAHHNFIGVVTEIKDVWKSRGDDYVLDFTIQDDFSTAATFTGLASMRCKFFRRTEALLPKPGAIGDIALIRNIRFSTFNNKSEAVSSSRLRSDALFFPLEKIPELAFSTPYGPGGLSELPWSGTTGAAKPSRMEQMAVINLKAASAPPASELQQSAAKRATHMSPARYKTALIQDVAFNMFYDLTGEVIKVYDNAHGEVDLYISDYTVNKDLFLYEDPQYVEEYAYTSSKKWQGPYGQVTLQIHLWEPHAAYVRDEVREGDFVYVNNVHIKLSQANKLEGALHQDRNFIDKVYVRKVTHTKHIEEIQARKKEYLEKSELDQAKQALHNSKQGTKVSKKKSKTKETKRRLEMEQAQELEAKLSEKVTLIGSNAHIRTSFPSLRLSTVNEILLNHGLQTKTRGGEDITLPFVNCKYRSHIRVVDFYPPSLEDFSHSMTDPTWDTTLLDPMSYDRRRDDSWKWGFVLLVEDANAVAGSDPERMLLFVHDLDAQYLLRMNAVDLRHDHGGQTKQKLEEQLFILWGNLYELKTGLGSKGITFPLPTGDKRLQNTPFELCIEEYGVPVPKSAMWPYGWQRMHKMVKTTIMGTD